MARPFGTKKEWQSNKKVIQAKRDTEKWAYELAPIVREKFKERLIAPDSSAVVVKGIGEIILKIVSERYKELDGKAEYITEDEAKAAREKQQSEEAKKEADKNGGSPFLTLTYVEPTNVDSTGTDD